ncbi:MAG: hypothetical protein IJW77_16265 [Clostridia bacterium]|nr:hypothetical protein [Clostridia bacterium]
MKHQLSSKFCESLGMSVILCREDGEDRYRCLSSHLCGGEPCGDAAAQTQKRAEDNAPKA